ncbi:AN1-like Zinc finger [Cooperia oncophora]
MMPPANIDELLEIKADFCHRKLALTEQHIRCLCEQRFCKKHRLPSAHLCGIDYKQTGRSRINKENPKISEGGYHKARED